MLTWKMVTTIFLLGFNSDTRTVLKGKVAPYCCTSSLVGFCETGPLQYTFFWNTFLLPFFAIIRFHEGEFLSVSAALSKALPPLRTLGPWVQEDFQSAEFWSGTCKHLIPEQSLPCVCQATRPG